MLSSHHIHKAPNVAKMPQGRTVEPSGHEAQCHRDIADLAVLNPIVEELRYFIFKFHSVNKVPLIFTHSASLFSTAKSQAYSKDANS